MTSSAKFFGTSVTSGNSAYNKNFNQSGLDTQNTNQPWTYKYSNGSTFITTTNSSPIYIISPMTTGDLTVNGITTISGNTTVNGNLVVNGTITTLSDLNAKKNIINLKDQDDMLNDLRVVEFEYINSNKGKHYGFIAQEVEEIYPDLIVQSNNYKTINYIEFIPLIIAKVNKLEKKVKEYENNNIMYRILVVGAIGTAIILINFPFFITH